MELHVIYKPAVFAIIILSLLYSLASTYIPESIQPKCYLGRAIKFSRCNKKEPLIITSILAIAKMD